MSKHLILRSPTDGTTKIHNFFVLVKSTQCIYHFWFYLKPTYHTYLYPNFGNNFQLRESNPCRLHSKQACYPLLHHLLGFFLLVLLRKAIEWQFLAFKKLLPRQRLKRQAVSPRRQLHLSSFLFRSSSKNTSHYHQPPPPPTPPRVPSIRRNLWPVKKGLSQNSEPWIFPKGPNQPPKNRFLQVRVL